MSVSENKNEYVFQYEPYKSFIHTSFWYKLSDLKLNIDKLNDNVRNIYGFYTNSNAKHCLLEIDCTAFNSEFAQKNCIFPCYGTLHNKNTIEDFKDCDKNLLLQKEGERIWERIGNGECINNPSLLTSFVLISFCDLKKYNFYYWFAFPTLIEPVIKSLEEIKCEKITKIMSSEDLECITKLYFNLEQSQKSFFILQKLQSTYKCIYLKERITIDNCDNNFKNSDLNNLYFCFSDPCPFEHAGWPLRNFIAFLTHLCPFLRGKTITLLSVRVLQSINIENSLLYKVQLPTNDLDRTNLKWFGWEKSDDGKYKPRSASLASSMDPNKLAESAVNLNLKLMKWRLLPDLNLDIMANTKCLLLGAGTLGCTVARNLLAWGVNTISFIDNGKVSMSNPVRQSLYRHTDALNGGLDKATTAAERLKEISPNVNAKGYNIYVPMPGHPVGAHFIEKTKSDIKIIEDLIKEHDVLFLLTDSRESRWLAAIIGTYFKKIIISAALGFESYLIIRHGVRKNKNDDDDNDDYIRGHHNFEIINGNLKCIPGNHLGCYFCTDITAPGNSLKDRTLDQQCTVTRPGVSNFAGSFAVELLMSILQHPDRGIAPAYLTINNRNYRSPADLSIPEGLLGIIPHSIRGSISSFDFMLPATQRFFQCIACSDIVSENYEMYGNEFLFKVFETTKYLEDLTGISALTASGPDIMDFSDSELASVTDSD